jgi:hypothetical protein
MAILKRYSSLEDQTSSSPSSDSKATIRKTASRNSCRHFSAIQRSFQKLWLFWLVSQVLPTRPPRHRVAIPQQPQWKQPPQTLVKIERDQTVGSKFMAILKRYSSLADHTSSSPSSDSKATIRKTASGNSCKNLNAIQQLDQKLSPFWPVTQGWTTTHPRHLVGNPKQP